MTNIFLLLSLAKEQGASDLHMIAGYPPSFRIDGSLSPVEGMEPLAPDDISQALSQIASEVHLEQFHQEMELDLGFTIPDLGRFRCNVARQLSTISIVIRLLPLKIPTLEVMHLPDICKELVSKPRGLVVVTGPTGSGKSTTLAAMLDHLNNTENRRVVTIEDPIEYVYTSNKCTFTQRELGNDTRSFAEALRHVLRQDPDVILVGEMRDTETAAAALTIAETGHLVLTTGHAPSTYQAIERIVDLFPPYERPLVQSRLASLIIGILCQTLVPRADGKGRVAAVEIMLGNPAVMSLIRDGKIHQIPNVIRTHARMGMKLLDQALLELYRQKTITSDVVAAVCHDRDETMKFIGQAD
jgi:twitching motility protein PilT